MNSKSNMNLQAHSCRFCTYFGGKGQKDGIDFPWLADDKYAALVSVGALVPGWTLICPIEHKLNMGEHYRTTEFWEFASQVEEVVRNRYGSTRVFEHGARATDSLTSCGIGHAHLHLVPLVFPLTIEALRFDPDKSWQPCSASQIEERTGGREYLFVSDQFEAKETKGLLCVLSEGTSQFFRRVIARRIGLNNFYDYRQYPMMDIGEASVRALREDALALHK
jgi:diadenosine tetraphosphate (Ap4A) HIT family hydrolase